MQRKTIRKRDSDVPVAPVTSTTVMAKKTRKQRLADSLSSEKFLQIKSNIQKNIELYKQKYETELQNNPANTVELKKYKQRITKYEWELKTLLANHPEFTEDAPPVPVPVIETPLPFLQPPTPSSPLPPVEPEQELIQEPTQEPTQEPEPVELIPPEEIPTAPEEIQVSTEQEPEIREEPPQEEQDIPPQPPKEILSAEIELEEPEKDAPEKKLNEYKKQMEKQQAKEEEGEQQPGSEYLYPTYNDPRFQSKIARRKEFYDHQYREEAVDIKSQSELLCKAEFEHLPHQNFVRNFLSPTTPYRSLLLYHQLGTGKTCTAIGVCEEFRETMKQMGTTKQQRILIVGSVNVKSNFRKQLFDEEKIRSIAKENQGNFDYQDIQLCAASSLLKEINPMNIRGLPLDSVIQQVNTLIDHYYAFFGYQSLANYINRYIQFKSSELQRSEYTENYLKQRRIEKIRQHFNGRLFVIDEAHNLRITSDNGDENSKKTSLLLLEIAQYAENVRFLLLTATPMYNSPEEVLWWTNLLNTNDRRSTISRSEVFTPAATNSEDTVEIFKPKEASNPQLEGGRELLQRKLLGYVSYVRGENPFSFPYRIYPNDFITDEQEKQIRLLNEQNRPIVQMNGKPITVPLQNIPVFLTQLQRDSYQYVMYDLCIRYLRQHHFTQKDKFGNQMERKGFEEMGGFGYTLLQIPVECLDIVFPSVAKTVLTSESIQGGALLPTTVAPANTDDSTTPSLEPETEEEDEDDDESDPETEPEPEEEEGEQTSPEEETREKILVDDPEWIKKKNILMNSIGEKGMRSTMSWKTIKNPPQKNQYEYKPEVLQSFGRFLSPENLPQYSSKFTEIHQRILRSTGVVLIYSEYIDGGVVPFALALEELGFERHVPKNSQFTTTLFNPQSQNFAQIQKRDALTMKPRNDPLFQTSTATFKQAKYALITGNASFSPNNEADLRTITSPENKYGELVKVVLITRAASEGVDFKFLRQVHILEPWYNMNRIEQIIGRGVRNNSHCMLPFEERNVEIYLHGTLLPPSSPSTQPIQPVVSTPPTITPTAPTSASDSNTELANSIALATSVQPVVPSQSSTPIAEPQQQPQVQKGGAELEPPQPPEEAADIYIYRIAERKAKKIGQVTRLLKEMAVDCILNIRQTKFTVKDLEAVASNRNLSITLSTDRKSITYQVGDKPFTDICDYMDNCAFQCADTTQISDAEVQSQTYPYSHIKTNRPMILKRIRQLFREEMVYTGKQIIQLVRGAKEYPEVQIYDTLTYLLQNDNEMITDKYGRLGRLTNHGSYYAFLPLELQNTRASLLERQRPLDYKRPYVRFEPLESSTAPTAAVEEETEKVPKLITDADKEETEVAVSEPAIQTQDIQQMFAQTLQKIGDWIAQSSSSAPLPNENSEDKQIKAWFRSIPAAKNMVEYLFTTYLPQTPQPTVDEYFQYSLYHALDLLSTDEKLALAYVVFMPQKETESFVTEQERTAPLFQTVATYFQSRWIEGKEKQTALVLAHFDSKTSQTTNQFWSMTLEPSDETTTKHMGWYPVSETDVPVFFQQAFAKKMEVPHKQIHYKFGFMRPFLSKGKIQTGEVVLHIKNLNQKTRNNKGARVDQALGQDLRTHIQNVLAIPTVIAFPPAIQKISSIMGLSVSLEMVLRWKDRKPNSISTATPATAVAKKYFFTLEEAVANKVDKLFCQIDGTLNVVSCE